MHLECKDALVYTFLSYGAHYTLVKFKGNVTKILCDHTQQMCLSIHNDTQKQNQSNVKNDSRKLERKTLNWTHFDNINNLYIL